MIGQYRCINFGGLHSVKGATPGLRFVSTDDKRQGCVVDIGRFCNAFQPLLFPDNYDMNRLKVGCRWSNVGGSENLLQLFLPLLVVWYRFLQNSVILQCLKSSYFFLHLLIVIGVN